MLPQTSSNIADTQRQGPLACISRCAARSAKLAGAAAFIALLASSGTVTNAAENPLRIAQERHACGVVLGYDPSDRRYDTCASEASIGAWRNGIGRRWFRLTAAHAPRRDWSPARRLSQSVW